MSPVERTLLWLEDRRLVQRVFNPPRGLFARVAGLAEGAGFAAGPAYRIEARPSLSVTASGVLSTKGYSLVEAALDAPDLARGRLFVLVTARRFEFPEEIFGPFRNYGTRPDDSNDIYPHEHHRELRANRVFAASIWASSERSSSDTAGVCGRRERRDAAQRSISHCRRATDRGTNRIRPASRTCDCHLVVASLPSVRLRPVQRETDRRVLTPPVTRVWPTVSAVLSVAQDQLGEEGDRR